MSAPDDETKRKIQLLPVLYGTICAGVAFGDNDGGDGVSSSGAAIATEIASSPLQQTAPPLGFSTAEHEFSLWAASHRACPEVDQRRCLADACLHRRLEVELHRRVAFSEVEADGDRMLRYLHRNMCCDCAASDVAAGNDGKSVGALERRRGFSLALAEPEVAALMARTSTDYAFRVPVAGWAFVADDYSGSGRWMCGACERRRRANRELLEAERSGRHRADRRQAERADTRRRRETERAAVNARARAFLRGRYVFDEREIEKTEVRRRRYKTLAAEDRADAAELTTDLVFGELAPGTRLAD